jgi:predicted Rossmann fold nucleotide-binding protein DprA/Smf involved in DNA uptake
MKTAPVSLPSLCAHRVGPEIAARIVGVGETNLLANPLLGLIASRECPGNVLIETLDLVPQWVKTGWVIVSGFHSPLEQQVLRSVVRRKGRVVKVLARGLDPDRSSLRLTSAEGLALRESRLLVISPFGSDVTRTTRVTSLQRNQFVLALSDKTVVPHVSSGSPMEGLLRDFKDRIVPSGGITFTNPNKT